MVICLERGADLHMAQLMPLPLTVSCFSKIQIGFTFLVPAHLGSPGEMAVKQVCVCAAVLTAKGPHSCCHLPKIVEIIEHTLDIPYTLQWMSTQNCQFPTEPETPRNTEILGSTGVHILNSTSMGSLTSCRADSCDKQTDRQTDTQTIEHQ